MHIINTSGRLLKAFTVLSLLAILSACQERPPVPTEQTVVEQEVVFPTIRPATLSGMVELFELFNYDWQDLENGVPPFLLVQFPDDIDRSKRISEKKRAFFMGLLPMVLIANQEILAERRTFLEIIDQHQQKHSLPDDKREQIRQLAEKYGLRGSPLTDHRVRTRLLKRINTIPPSLALAQAANESAWGTSRFARLGNNLFGQWTFKPGTGIVPLGRPPGATYEVAKFRNLFESIRSYMLNLNKNGAYSEFRELRYRLSKEGRPVTGLELAKGLLRYSTRREEYVREIRQMILQNELMKVNKTALRVSESQAIASTDPDGSGLVSSRNRIIGSHSPTGQHP